MGSLGYLLQGGNNKGGLPCPTCAAAQLEVFFIIYTIGFPSSCRHPLCTAYRETFEEIQNYSKNSVGVSSRLSSHGTTLIVPDKYAQNEQIEKQVVIPAQPQKIYIFFYHLFLCCWQEKHEIWCKRFLFCCFLSGISVDMMLYIRNNCEFLM